MPAKPPKPLLMAGLICLIGLAAFASSCSWQSSEVLSDVEPPQIAQTTIVYDRYGNIITQFRGEQHRLDVRELNEVPLIVQNAVIAIEDERFWEHSGVDLRAMIRAARSNLDQGGVSEGGSTITQQYVGLTFLDRSDRSADRKINEISLALQFERRYTKEFILKNYLNTVYFGEGAYGIKAAGQEYFNKDLNQLSIAEAALLAGLIQAPGSLNPYSNPDGALARRKVVLDRMLANNWISEHEFEIARTEPVNLAQRVAVLEETYIAPHFVEDARQWILSNPIFGATREERAELLFEGGLRIYTTLDPDLQMAARQAVDEVLTDPEGPDASVVLIENDTGYVRAMVGGRDFFSGNDDAKFNLATQGGRQAGSTFKPIVLATALERGFSLKDTYIGPDTIDLPIDGLEQTWSVKGGANPSTYEDQKLTLQQGVISSVNTVFAQVVDEVGPENVVTMAHRLGIESELQPVLSITLGSEDVTTMDMATAFMTIARRGLILEPTLVTRVATAKGGVLYEHKIESNRVLSSEIADHVINTLHQAVDRGTGWKAQIPGYQIAGKTGTAENFNDASFSGFSPNYTASVWVGFPGEQISMVPPITPIEVFGGTYPADIFNRVMTAAVTKDQPINSFPPAREVDDPPAIEPRSVSIAEHPVGKSRFEAVQYLYDLDLIVSVNDLDPFEHIEKVPGEVTRFYIKTDTGNLLLRNPDLFNPDDERFKQDVRPNQRLLSGTIVYLEAVKVLTPEEDGETYERWAAFRNEILTGVVSEKYGPFRRSVTLEEEFGEDFGLDEGDSPLYENESPDTANAPTLESEFGTG